MKLKFNEIFARMLDAGNIKNSSHMARALGISPQAVSNYRKKGEIPAGIVIEFAEKYAISVDWLLTGRGDALNELISSGKTAAPFAMTAAEAGQPYANDAGRHAPCHLGIASLSSDEIIYVGKLLKIMRGPERSSAKSLTHSIDAFLMSDSFQTKE